MRNLNSWELTPILRDSKHQSEVNNNEVINGVMSQVWVTKCPLDPQTHPVNISPVPVCVLGMHIFGIWQNPCSAALIQEVMVIMVGRVQGSLWTYPLSQGLNWKHSMFMWKLLKCHHERFKRCRAVMLFIFPFIFSYWPVQNVVGFWKSFHYFNFIRW